MAASMKHLSLLFLLFLTSSFQTQARESQFFSKTFRSSETSPIEATAFSEKNPAVQAEEPFSLPPQSHSNGYGLYAHDSEQSSPATTSTTTNYDYNYNKQFSPTTTTTATNYNYNRNDDRVARSDRDNNIPSSFTNTELSDERYGNKESTANNIPSKFSDKEFGRGSYESKDPTYAYDNKMQYGMSDTRVMENGKYYYDVNAEGYGKQYEPAVKGNVDGFGSNDGFDARPGSYGSGGYSHGHGNGNGNKYEYSSGTEGYKNSQDNEEMEDEYVP